MLRITMTNQVGFNAPQDEAVDQFYVPSAYEVMDTFSVDIVFECKYLIPADPEDPLSEETYEYASYPNTLLQDKQSPERTEVGATKVPLETLLFVQFLREILVIG